MVKCNKLPGKGYGIQKISFMVFLTALILLLSTATASAIYTLQGFGTDGFRYLNGTNITASGKLMNGSAGEQDANITIELYNSSGSLWNSFNTTTDSTGAFSQIIPIDNSGSYSIVARAPEFNLSSTAINVLVYDVNDISSVAASFTRGEVYVVTLTAGAGSKNINGTPYNFYVSSNNTVTVGDVSNLITGSKIKLGNDTYSIFFVNRNSEIVLARMVQPMFSSAGYRNLTLLALNASYYPLTGKSLSIVISNVSGIIGSFDFASTFEGVTTSNISLPPASGIYTVQILYNGQPVGTITYSVNSYDVISDVLSMEWRPQRTFAKGNSLILSAGVKTIDGLMLNGSQAGVVANVRGPSGFSQQFSLSFNSDKSLFNYTYAIPDNAAQGTYTVEYVTTIGAQTLRGYSSFEVRGYSIFLKPISGKVSELEGFFPGEKGYILVSGADLGTGEVANVHQLTGGSNRSNFTFTLKNSEGTDMAGNWDVMSLSDFFGTGNVEPWLQEEIRARSPNASVINFTAPSMEGIYHAKVVMNLSGTTEEASTSIGVQKIFLYAYPVSSDGRYAMSVSSQENVTLRIEAFNPQTMSTETNITDAGIIEAFAMDAGEMVTDRMLNSSLVPLPGGSKGLMFYNNDSNLGFHMVKFWANVTMGDGNTTQAIGTGFFDVRLYLIWASPASDEGGNYRIFTNGSDISLRVTVMNTGFSPQQGKQVSIDEVRYGRSWEVVEFNKNTDSNWTGTTDSNGTATLSFTPSGYLKSGWYDVKIKLTTQDSSGNTVVDYGRGWFEVRNFMFRVYPESWNVKAGENISFTVQAVNATNTNSNIDTNIRIKMVMLRTDWMQPPVEVAGPHQLNNTDHVTISTNMSTTATVVYTSGKTNRSGMYEFVFEATSGSAVEEERAMLEIRPFAAWVWLPQGNWNNRFGINNTINLIVHASDSNWGGNPIKLNASLTNITSVTKMGMFGGSKYKTQSELNISSVTQDTDNNSVNITLTLTGWQEGGYDMVIRAVDDNGSEVMTHFWMEVEIASVGLPQLHTTWVSEGRVFTNTVSINLTDTPSQVPDWEKKSDGRYPDLNTSIASNSKVGVFGGNEREFLRDSWKERPRKFWALVNLSEPRLYVNYNNSNFSDSINTQDIAIDGTFNESDISGSVIRHWRLESISSDGTVNFVGIDALNNGFIIDPSISKSGSFLMEDHFTDSQWLKVDLDGNGRYEKDWTNPDDRNDTYYVILADNTTAGTYDTVFVSNRTNFTGYGINATSGAPVTFGGAPIYYISMRKESSGYVVQFTSYVTGWDGMWLGTFEKGKPLKIPFLVQQPGTSEGVSGANVVVDRLTWYAPGSDIPVGASSTTDSNGLALIDIDTSSIPTGQYLISYSVTLPDGKVKAATEKWRMPGMEIRKFIVEAEMGDVGMISTHKITNGSGLAVLYGDEIEPKGVASAYHWGPPGSNISRVGWPFDMENEYYYNRSDGKYYTLLNFTTWETEGSPIDNSSINLTRKGANTTYDFLQFIPAGPASNKSLNQSEAKTFWKYWNITALSINPPNAQLQIEYLPAGDQPPSIWNVNVGTMIFWGPGELNINITAVEPGTPPKVRFELFQPKIIYKVKDIEVLLDKNPSNGEWASGRVTKVNYKGYNVYGYNDVNQTEPEKQQFGWSPTLDRVLVTNSTWNRTYRIGERIPELNNEYVGLAARWGGKIIFVNDSIGIYPLQDWAPDGDTYYVGSFTESDVNADLNDNRSTTDNNIYHIRLEDNNPNGVFNVTSGVYDDDYDFTQAWSQSTGAIDLYSAEQGQDIFDWMGTRKFDERWISIGSIFGWPFGVPDITYNGIYANLTTFKSRWEPFDISENVTMYLNAKTFSNQPINGNVSLDKLIVNFKFNISDKEQPQGTNEAPQVYENLEVVAPVTNGIGVWRINYSVLQPVVGSFDGADFVARLKVTDGTDFEVVERHFFMVNQTAGGMAGGCKPPEPCSGGGTGGGSGGGKI